MLKAKKPVKKKTSEIQLTPELVVESKEEIPDFSALYQSWQSAAGEFSISLGKTDTNILEFINNMGKVGRTVYVQGKEEDKPPEAPPQEYVNRAKLAGSKNYYSTEQIEAVAALKEYLEAQLTPDSKVNPANISFNSIRSYDKKGKILAQVRMFGDYRTPKYVSYRRRHKDQTVDAAKQHWYSTKPNSAKPPVWQALFGDGKLDFKHPSLLMMCNMVLEAMEQSVINRPEKPLKVRALEKGRKKGVAGKWIYENISGFKNWFDGKIRDPNYTVKTSGNFASRKLHREMLDESTRRAKISFKLSDAESQKLLAWLGSKQKVDLDNVYLDISRRQLANLAEIAGFKNVKQEDGVKKQDFSEWRHIIKAVQ